MGGRGNSGSRNNTFKNESDFEKSLTGFEDPRLEEYSKALEEESKYNTGLKNNLNSAIAQDGYDEGIDEIIAIELRRTQKSLDSMPEKKTPAQLGEEAALKERVNILKNFQKRKGTVGRGRGDVSITTGGER